MDVAEAGAIPATHAPSPAPVRGGGLLHVALVGNPNTGKSTLFNALTGMRQRVGNYSGVTVERVEGRYRDADGRPVNVLDLPGTYSLSASSPDEEIALGVLLGRAEGVAAPDVVVVVVDAQNLERNLFLASQVLELGLPTVVALNQVDAALAAGIRVDPIELTLELGAPVVATVATKGEGLDLLKQAVGRAAGLPPAGAALRAPPEAAAALAPLEACLVGGGLNPVGLGHGGAAAAGHHARRRAPGARGRAGRRRWRRRARGGGGGGDQSPRSLEAEARYGWIAGVVERWPRRRTREEDAHRPHRRGGAAPGVGAARLRGADGAGLPEHLHLGGAADGPVEGLFGALGGAVGSRLPAGDLRSLVVDGVIGGVGSVLVFLPQICILFLFIGILEDTGYMARAAFIMDRFMRSVGLHGRSFIPLLSGYACAVPGVMSTRTIESPKDRLATIMVLPLMSCSARIPIYTLLIGAFIPPLTVAGIFNLQGVTLLVHVPAGHAHRAGHGGGVQEDAAEGARPADDHGAAALPPPRVRSLALSVGHRASLFLRKAGTVILSLTIVLWALATYPKTHAAPGTPPAAAQEQQLAGSVLGRMGHAIEPAVRPLGYDWKIGVGIVSSFAAREVFVSTMGTIYGVGSADETSPTLRDRLLAERNERTGCRCTRRWWRWG
jgi:ferrous iron transport protein B